MADATAQVQQKINDNAVVVFSKSYCPYCKTTKSTLKELTTAIEVVELDQIPEGSDLQDALEQLNGQRTVPNIYINKKHIGGNSDLQSLRNAGKLNGLLKEAGVLAA
jgi:glutaredoxin 3